VHDTLVDGLVGQELRDLVEAFGKTHELIRENLLHNISKERKQISSRA
jgi:hypothetical protein